MSHKPQPPHCRIDDISFWFDLRCVVRLPSEASLGIYNNVINIQCYNELGADLVYEYETQQSIATLCMLYYDHGFMYIL